MSAQLKGGPPSPSSGGDNAFGAENTRELLRSCLQSIHEVTRRYYYRILDEKNVPGCLSYLLGISEERLVYIFKLCGFYNSKKSAFLGTDFEVWVAASFDAGTMEVTTFKRERLIKIGTGASPEKPASQSKEGLEPPKFRMRRITAGGQGSQDSLTVLLFNKLPPTEATVATRTTATATTPTKEITETTIATAAAATVSELRVPRTPVKLSQKFNITSPDKLNLTMELVCDMDSPQRAPLLRELVRGSSVSIDALNNQKKKFVHIPQCSTQASVMSQNVKQKFVQEIVNTLGNGFETVTNGLHNGAVWLCRVLADLYMANASSVPTFASYWRGE
jgi:hypothetical protein